MKPTLFLCCAGNGRHRAWCPSRAPNLAPVAPLCDDCPTCGGDPYGYDEAMRSGLPFDDDESDIAVRGHACDVASTKPRGDPRPEVRMSPALDPDFAAMAIRASDAQEARRRAGVVGITVAAMPAMPYARPRRPIDLFDGCGPRCPRCMQQKLRPHPNPLRPEYEIFCMGCGVSSNGGYEYARIVEAGAARLVQNFRAMDPSRYETKRPKEQAKT